MSKTQRATRVVLSHPFSGSVYAFFAEQAGAAPAPKPRHPYYRTLFGANFASVSDLSLTLALLFQEIILNPADTHLPRYEGREGGTSYHNPHLGLTADWHDLPDHQELEDRIGRDLTDNVLAGFLKTVPPEGRRQILSDARCELYLAARHECPIVAGSGRRRIFERLAEIDADTEGARTYPAPRVDAVAAYVEIAGLTFRPRSLEKLYSLKESGELRKYGDAFVTALARFDKSQDVRRDLLLAMNEAMEQSTIAQAIAGGFDATSLLFNLPSLLPGIGPLFTLGSAASSGGAKLAARRQKSQSWYEFGPQVQRIGSLADVRAHIDAELANARE